VKKHFGKYRGLVTNNIDPNRMGRLQVACPTVLEANPLAWAMPCVPFAGLGEGFYMMPMPGSNVWVEFEAGDPGRPIWSGCFWTTNQIPTEALLPTVRTISTLAARLTLDDTPGIGGVTITVGPPAVAVPCTISCGIDGIEITVGKAKIMLDVVMVNVNDGALQVI
jgi:Type VI secretion system/phage-baseplate injector OB domain